LPNLLQQPLYFKTLENHTKWAKTTQARGVIEKILSYGVDKTVAKIGDSIRI
jgi:hypothetical protein